jgi:hypothetical protein
MGHEHSIREVAAKTELALEDLATTGRIRAEGSVDVDLHDVLRSSLRSSRDALAGTRGAAAKTRRTSETWSFFHGKGGAGKS